MYVERVGGYLGARSPVEARRVGTMCNVHPKKLPPKRKKLECWGIEPRSHAERFDDLPTEYK